MTNEPKYQTIKNALLEELRRGNYLPGHSFITERELCRTYGVSRITAVRALTELVNEGYLVRQQGRGTFVAGPPDPPPPRDVCLIGCILPEIHHHHVMEILTGIQKVCARTDRHLLLFDSTSRPDIEADNIRRARKAGAQGLIIYPVEGFANSRPLETSGLPTVLIDRYYPDLALDAVLPDSFDAAYQLTTLMIEREHRNIALVWGEAHCTSVRDNLSGYRRAHQEHGIPISADLCILRSYDSLTPPARQHILRYWLDRAQPPTAYLASNSHTMSILAADLKATGLNIAQLALGSFADDNPEVLTALGSSFTTLPSRHIGEQALELLLERINGNIDPTQTIVLPITLQTS